MKTATCALLLALSFLGVPLQAAPPGDIPLLEKLVLGDDRASVIRELVPGTEHYYFFTALEAQNNGDRAMVAKTLRDWAKRHPKRSTLRREIETRENLFRYDVEPKRSLAALARDLELRFDHEKPDPEKKPRHPSQLAPDRVSRDAFLKAATKGGHLNAVEGEALDWIVREGKKLTVAQRRQVLIKVQTPGLRGLVPLIAADLRGKGGPNFGDYRIHQQLTLTQMDALEKQVPKLRISTAFVETYLKKLRPSDPATLAHDDAAALAFLGEAWDFAKDLPPVFNTLKVHLAYHQLRLRWNTGRPNRKLFQTYIEIPRNGRHVNPVYLKDDDRNRFTANCGKDLRSLTMMPAVGDDAPLLRRYLLEIFAGIRSWETYATYLSDSWLKPIFAEAKITSGRGNPEKWFSLLKAAELETLRDRVDLEFSQGKNPKQHDRSEAVQLKLNVKNVRELLVNVYELNALNYYQNFGREIDTDIDLDGLVANEQRVFRYDGSPYLRVERAFDFPSLAGRRGAWVVEFIGNGKSSRAIIRKGALHYLEHATSSGQLLTVLDENLAHVKTARAILGGKEYSADENGRILLPYSSAPDSQTILLSDGEVVSRESFAHRAEEYHFAAAFHIDREQLIAGARALLAIRPQLKIHDTPTTIGLLQNVTLTITTTDRDGTEAQDVVRNFGLSDADVALHPFVVPPRLAELRIQLEGIVPSRGIGAEAAMSASRLIRVNEIDEKSWIDDLYLRQIGGRQVLELRDRAGQEESDRVVRCTFRRRGFGETIEILMKTDERGRIDLGQPDALEVTTEWGKDRERVFDLRPQIRADLPELIHARAGEKITIPDVEGDAFASLLEMRGDEVARDRSDAISARKGTLVIAGLREGFYRFRKGAARIAIEVSAGGAVDSHIVGERRFLEQPPAARLGITDISVKGETLRIAVDNATEFSRVHVIGAAFVLATPSPYGRTPLTALPLPTPRSIVPARRQHVFVSERRLGDELRYVLDRRQRARFPGNMLERPGLLLNPWQVKETETETQSARDGEAYVAQKSDTERLWSEDGAEQDRRPTSELDSLATTAFLKAQSRVFYNLQPDKNGEVRIKLADLGDRQHVHVIATDLRGSVSRAISLAETPALEVRDIRLAKVQLLDLEKHLSYRNKITVLREGESVELPGAATANVASYPTIESAYDLLGTLVESGSYRKFAFLSRWPKLTTAEKRDAYSEFACHELNLFLSRKDPAFFETVIAPYLANKFHKTFVDRYLLEEDLKDYLRPSEFGRLNVAERALLARRIPDARETIAKGLRHHVELLPDRTEWKESLFSAALQGGSLDALETFVPRDRDPEGDAQAGLLLQKLRNIVLPQLQFEDATIEESITFLPIKSRELDNLESDPSRRGINFILNVKSDETTPRITLSLTNVPLGIALKAITDLAGLRYRIEPFAVVVVPLTDDGQELYTRVFQVPRGFVPLGQTAINMLESRGVTFSEGASAHYQSANSQLIVRNTATNLDLTETAVEFGVLTTQPDDVNPSGGSSEEDVRGADDAEMEGDESASDRDYDVAIARFQRALDLLPQAPTMARKRRRLVSKFAKNSILRANDLANMGERDAARAMISRVLASDMDPNNGAAKTLLKDLSDPQKYSQAMTPEHGRQVKSVEGLLELGVGYYDLGQFDRAKAQFNKVLKLDRYNTAARRLLERTERSISRSYASARDHQRAHMLRMVDEQWAVPVPAAPSAPPPLYEKLDATKEWAENNYYHIPAADQTARLIGASEFWRDYASWDGNGAFVSEHFAQASRSGTEALLALAVLDLPFAAQPPKTWQDGSKSTLQSSGTPVILFHRELIASEPSSERSPIIVGQHVFRLGERYRFDGEKRITNYVTDEFLPGIVYVSEVVATNTGEFAERIDLLAQLPEGAVPVSRSKRLAHHSVLLQPFETAKQTLHFFFPQTGSFRQFPAHLSKDGMVVAFAPGQEFQVVEKLSNVDKTAWGYVSAQGTSAEVLAYLQRENLGRVQLRNLAWRMRDATFFSETMEVLRSRGLFDPTLYAYAVHHNDVPVIREYLRHYDGLLDRCGSSIDTTLLKFDALSRGLYEHMEYRPLVNARAHQLGATRTIANPHLAGQWRMLLEQLIYVPKNAMTDSDRLATVYYLLAQDRIAEADALFRAIEHGVVATKLQRDYLSCYLDFSHGRPEAADATAAAYADYPVPRWRKYFETVRQQAKEIAGGIPTLGNPKDREQRQDTLAGREPTFSLLLAEGAPVLQVRNIREITLNFYELDLEFLFSSNPFFERDTKRFSSVRPNRSETVAISKDGPHRVSIAIPDHFANKNVLIEATASGRSESLPFFANSLAVDFAESYGRLQVRDGKGKPVSKVYVKAYARTRGGGVVFHKDGYTDLRGKFDYASLSADESAKVERFAILVMSDENGALVREARAPAQ